MKKADLIKKIKSITPKTIKVLGVDFNIRFNHKVPKADRADRTYAFTIGDDREITIYVRRITSMDQFKSTLIHELLHAAIHVSGVTNSLNEEQEESVVMCLEVLVNGLMRFKDFSLETQETVE